MLTTISKSSEIATPTRPICVQLGALARRNVRVESRSLAFSLIFGGAVTLLSSNLASFIPTGGLIAAGSLLVVGATYAVTETLRGMVKLDRAKASNEMAQLDLSTANGRIEALSTRVSVLTNDLEAKDSNNVKFTEEIEIKNTEIKAAEGRVEALTLDVKEKTSNLSVLLDINNRQLSRITDLELKVETQETTSKAQIAHILGMANKLKSQAEQITTLEGKLCLPADDVDALKEELALLKAELSKEKEISIKKDETVYGLQLEVKKQQTQIDKLMPVVADRIKELKAREAAAAQVDLNDPAFEADLAAMEKELAEPANQ
jgi:chromosome segregation ATPase